MDKISERITSERTNKGTKCSCWILYNKLTTPAERGGALEKTYIYTVQMQGPGQNESVVLEAKWVFHHHKIPLRITDSSKIQQID